MDFEKMMLGNFRTNPKWGMHLMNYYMPTLYSLCVIIDEREEHEYNEQYTGDRRAELFRSDNLAASIMDAPFAKTYAAFTKLFLKELLKQCKDIYWEPEKIQTCENLISVYRAIYEGIEKLVPEERKVIKILFTINHVELAKKFLQFENTARLKTSAMGKMKDILEHEQFMYFEEWLKKASTDIGQLP